MKEAQAKTAAKLKEEEDEKKAKENAKVAGDVASSEVSCREEACQPKPEEPEEAKIPNDYPKEFKEFKNNLRTKVLINIVSKKGPLIEFRHYLPSMKNEKVKIELVDNPEFVSYDKAQDSLKFVNLYKEQYGQYTFNVKLSLGDKSVNYEVSCLIKEQFDFFAEMEKQGIKYDQKNQTTSVKTVEDEVEVICSAKIQSISGNGTLVIMFSHDMDSSSYKISSINEEVLDIVVLPSQDKLDSENFKQSDHSLTWKATSFSSRNLVIQLNFLKPLYISSELE